MSEQYSSSFSITTSVNVRPSARALSPARTLNSTGIRNDAIGVFG